jgi:Flp pilus assembly protein TadG
MLLTQRSATKRSGATVVEFAAVCTIFCMMLFGILEYSLFLYTYDVMQNAAREGTRFAVVNSEDANLVADTQSYVQTLMMGLDKTNTNYSCNVYLSDVNGNNINSTNPVANATTAAFGQPICVQISLTYKPLTPALFFPASAFTMQTLCYMSSEGN